MKIKYLEVSELNNYVKSLLDDNLFLQKVYLRGEISNYKNHPRGHLYFTLKDDSARLNAVMFASQARLLNFKPEDGMKVLVVGRVSAYPTQGTYQIYVAEMEPAGVGNLYLEFEKLKIKLAKAGLFALEHKKKIPKYPCRIGVITADTGAAIKDILSTLERRYPIGETILFPALVQGKEAAATIVSQIKKASQFNLDVLIIGRGGGSIEDLWAFNEEIVAQAIYECPIPIISGIGHEIDFTIADLVADLRAPTPTGAAELAVPTLNELKASFNQFEIRLNESIRTNLEQNIIRLANLKNSFILKNPTALYEVKEQKLDYLIEKLNFNYQLILNQNQANLTHWRQALETLNPNNTLKRGYAILKKDNCIIKTACNLKPNDQLEVELEQDVIWTKVVNVKKKEE